jgi:SAM-dependent methyltransferase
MKSGLDLSTDVLGRALLDAWRGELRAPVLLERDDGRVITIDVERWLATDVREGARVIASRIEAGERVLDAGCGAGAQALVLERIGAIVTALDISPGALEVASRRGLRGLVHGSIDDPHTAHGPFDAITLFGNNLGIAGTCDALPRFLASLAARLAHGGRILADVTNDGTVVEASLRLCYAGAFSEWFPWLWATSDVLRDAAMPAGLETAVVATTQYGYVAELTRN